MPSALDLLNSSEAGQSKSAFDIIDKPEVEAKSAMSLLEEVQQTPTTEVPTLPQAAPKFHNIAKDFYGKAWGLDIDNPQPYEGQADKVIETLARTKSLAQNPYDAIKGTAEFISGIPAFLTGLAAGAGGMVSTIAGSNNWTWNDLYQNARYEMDRVGETGEKYVTGTVSSILEAPRKAGYDLAEKVMGKEIERKTGDSSLVGEIYMAPYTAVSEPLHNLAEKFESENVKGLIHFAADAAGFVALGGLHGKAYAKKKAEEVKPIVERAAKVQDAQQVVDQIPNEAVKRAQQRIVDIEKKQLELEAERLRQKTEVEVAPKIELADKAEQWAEWEKEWEAYEPVVPKKAKVAKPVRKKIVRTKKEKLVEPPKVEDASDDFIKGLQQEQEMIYARGEKRELTQKELDRLEQIKSDMEIFEEFKKEDVDEGLVDIPNIRTTAPYDRKLRSYELIEKQKGKNVADAKARSFIEDANIRKGNLSENVMEGLRAAEDYLSKNAPEPIKQVDLQTGSKKGKKLTSESPFRQQKEVTDYKAKLFEENPDVVTENMESYAGKLINDVNRWLDGDESVDIAEVRNKLSFMAVRNEFGPKVGKMVSEAASWARNVERRKIDLNSDTRGQGQQFHGASNAIDQLQEYTYSPLNYYGQGLYTTDAIDIAKGYTKKGKGKNPSLYKVNEKNNLKLYDMEKPIEDWLVDKLRKDPNYIVLDALDENPKNLRELYDNVRDMGTSEGMSADTIQEIFDSVAYNLEEAGYQGLTHIGGLRTKKTPHKVNIYFNAARDLTIDRLENGRTGEGKGVKLTSGIDPSDVINIFANLWDKAAKSNKPDLINIYRSTVNKLNRGGMSNLLIAEQNLRDANLNKQADIIEGLRISLVEGSNKKLDQKLSKAMDELYGKTYTLNSGIPIDEVAKAIVDSAKKVKAYTEKARGIKSFKPVQAAQLLREEFNRAFVDRSGNIRREFLDKLGDEGYRIVQKMYLSKGASSLSAHMLEQMRKEVYSGLNKHEKNVLDNIVLVDRMLDIAKYKSEKQFKFPEGLDPKSSAAYRELYPQLEKLTPEQAANIETRAKAYFEWMKKPLQDMLDAELISQGEYDALVSHNYRRLKLVEIYDKVHTQKVGAKKRTVYDSGVEALQKGRDTDIFEPSSEVMALEVFSRAYGRILNNAANKELLDLAKSVPENPFARIKDRKNIIPSGWIRLFVYEGGERKAIYVSPDVAKEWISNSPEMSYRLSQTIRYASGSPVLRTFATGINWGFALANLPRDIMHTWFAARTFQDGKWESVYSPNAPVFGLQIGNDLRKVFIDAATKGPRYQQYIKEGGGMEFLVHQGRLFQRGRHIERPLDSVMNFMGYFGETSEIMTRLAIRERVIKNRARERGLSIEEARKNPDITREATFAARDYMDFGQGGGIAKAVDNGIPYLNATIQGTRGMVRAFRDNPMESSYKLAQFAALTTGLYIASKAQNPETMENLKGDINTTNNLVIPLGDDFSFVDETGQTRYPYIKIPLDPAQRFFKTFFEASADKWLGNEVDVDRVVASLKEQSPVGLSQLPPTISGALGYMANKDFWRNEDIWTRTERPLSFPNSKEEYIPGETPQAMIDIGQATGLSPERLRYAVSELVTNGTVWSYLAGKGYDEMFGDLPKDQKEKHLAMVLSKTPGIKRFFGITNPYSQFAEGIERVSEEEAIKRLVETRELDRRVEGYLYEGSFTKGEVFKYIDSFKDDDTAQRLEDRFTFQEAIKDLPNRSLWLRMKGLPPEARAKIYVELFPTSGPSSSEYDKVEEAGGVFSDKFWEEVDRLQVKE